MRRFLFSAFFVVGACANALAQQPSLHMQMRAGNLVARPVEGGFYDVTQSVEIYDDPIFVVNATVKHIKFDEARAELRRVLSQKIKMIAKDIELGSRDIQFGD